MKTVVDQFAEALASAGVKRVYGMVDGSLAILADAIRRQRKIEWLHVQHEEIAAFAAGAEARLTGELAVCAGNCGPDNPHLINGLIDCHRSQAPVLAVSLLHYSRNPDWRCIRYFQSETTRYMTLSS